MVTSRETMVDGFTQTLTAAVGCGQCVVTREEQASQIALEQRDVIRGLCHALDRAILLGQWSLADRIGEQALRIAHHNPPLAERIARCWAMQHRFHDAVALIDTCADRTTSLRLLRAVCLLKAGQALDAHLELLSLSSRAAAPMQARLLLAFLEWRTGDRSAAFAALLRNLRQLDDLDTLATLMLLSRLDGREAAAQTFAQRMQAAVSGHVDAPFYSKLLEAAGKSGPPVPAPSSPGVLANELLADESAIPAIVEAIQVANDHTLSRLLIDSLTLIFEECRDPGMIAHSLTILHEHEGQSHEAVAWRSRADSMLNRHDVLATIGTSAERSQEQAA